MNKPQNTDLLFYSIQGKGPAVVLIHGFLEDSSMWDNFTEALSEKAKVICVDLPGHGHSPLNVEDDMNAYAEAVFKVLDTEGIKDAAVVGHSMGGYVALAMAQLQKQRITKLVLLNSTFLADSPERKQKRQQAIGVIEENPRLFVTTVVPSLFPVEKRKPMAGVIQELISKASEMTAPAIITATLAMMHRPDSSEVFGQFAENGLIIIGKADHLVNPKVLISTSKGYGNQMELVDAGHMMPFETIDKVRIFLTKFIL